MPCRGFSLVELSIVLVILGLLTGGILAGQSLIRAAELRAVTTEHARYATAIQTFRDKYMGLPGDFRDATRFWTRQVNAAHCVTHSSAAVSTPGTCDGNGDGLVHGAGALSESNEGVQLWRQLAHAGLIEGSYSGLAGAAANHDRTPGENIPASKVAQGGWLVHNYGLITGNGAFYDMTYTNMVMLGVKSSSASLARGPIVRPEELWNIDTKMDDGKPAYGNVIATQWGTLVSDNRCTINAADSADRVSDYNLGYNGIACGIVFMGML